MRKLLKANSGVVWFSVLKYIEVAIMAFTTFFLAKKLGPKEMGLSIPVLLYITYANYLTLGVNQVVTKNLSRIDTSKITDFISINLQFILLVNLFNVGLAYLLLESRYALLAALISNFTFIRSFFASYYRGIYRIKVLNKNNIIFSFAIFTLVLLLVTTLEDYLIYWCVCLGSTLILYFVDDIVFFAKVFRNIFKIFPKENILFNLKEGMKLAITGLLITILLTADRLLINRMNIPVEVKGSYQLADYAGTAVYLFFTTILFYFYPKWIELIRNDKAFRGRFIKTMKIGLLAVPVILLTSYFFAWFIGDLFFPEYKRLGTLITLSIYIKLPVIYLSATSLFYIGIDKELYYIKSLRYLFGMLTVIFLFFFYFKALSWIWIPVIIGTLIFVEALKKIFQLSADKELYK